MDLTKSTLLRIDVKTLPVIPTSKSSIGLRPKQSTIFLDFLIFMYFPQFLLTILLEFLIKFERGKPILINSSQRYPLCLIISWNP